MLITWTTWTLYLSKDFLWAKYVFEWQRVPILMFKLSLLKFPIVSSCIFDDLYIITVNLLIYIYIYTVYTYSMW